MNMTDLVEDIMALLNEMEERTPSICLGTRDRLETFVQHSKRYELMPVRPNKGMLDAARQAPTNAVYLDSLSEIANMRVTNEYHAMVHHVRGSAK